MFLQQNLDVEKIHFVLQGFLEDLTHTLEQHCF
jgi:hypothetical protein